MDEYINITLPSGSGFVQHDEEGQLFVHHYEDGEEIKQIWNPLFVVFAYMIALMSSYAAVHLLDHGLWFWRSEELKNAAIIKHPDIYAACILGLGTVWCMHFVS